MAYTAKILTSSEYAALEGTTEFKELFTSSKAHLNSDTFAYSMFANKVTEVQSYDDDFMTDFWYSQFSAYVNRADEGTKDFNLIASYDDDKLIGLEGGFYDSSDNSAWLCISLYTNNKAGSRDYVFNASWINSRATLRKNLGAVKQVTVINRGSSIGTLFQNIVTANPSSVVPKLSSLTTADVELTYEYGEDVGDITSLQTKLMMDYN